MKRDKLILLEPGFEDPAFPGRRFFCWHCMLLEGVLASFPQVGTVIDVERVAWPRPRTAVVDLLGRENESLPVLILADDAPSGSETSVFNGRRFVADKDAILRVFSLRCGIPEPHP